jgi:hypothetical protein
MAPSTSERLPHAASKRTQRDPAGPDLSHSCACSLAKRTTAPARIESTPAQTPVRIFSTLHGYKVLLLTPITTICCLKEQLHVLTGMPPNEQRLLKCLPLSSASRYEPLPTTDHSLLSCFQVGRGSELLMVPADGRTICIFIRTFTGRTITLEARSEDTIMSIKLQIRNQIRSSSAGCCSTSGDELTPDRQRLIFACKQLEDSRTLVDLRIKKGDTLHLLQQEQGGS